MRIIAGKYKGRTLESFSGDAVRPTSDRAREALFSCLQFEIEGKKFLDAFCGSGAVGIEALSRGAKETLFIDAARDSAEITKKNLNKLNITARVLNTDCTEFLKHANEKFDIVFLDPPYKSESGKNALEIIAKRDLLNENGLCIIERGSAFNELIDGLFIEKQKKYGIANFTFYRLVDKDTCVFAGSFDPITNGHKRIVERALEKYKKVIVAIGNNENKTYMLDRFTREKAVKATFEDNPRVEVVYFDGLLVDFLKSRRVTDNVRGLRNKQDYDYEQNMFEFNRKLYPEIKNIYIQAENEFLNISSHRVREIILSGGDFSELLDKNAYEIVKAALKL